MLRPVYAGRGFFIFGRCDVEDQVGMILIAVFGFVAVLLAVIPSLMIKARRDKLRKYLYETEAEVIDIRQERFKTGYDYDLHTRLFVPVFRYYAGGQEIIHHSRVGTSENIYSIGQRVPVRVDPYDPRKFVLVNSKPHKLATGILYAISAFFLLATIASAFILNRIG